MHAFHDRLHPARPFVPALARGCTQPKPSPHAIHHCATAWGVAPHEVVVIGDSAADDVVAGNRAGAHTILIDHDDLASSGTLQGELQPTAVASSLEHAAQLLNTLFHLLPPGGRGGRGVRVKQGWADEGGGASPRFLHVCAALADGGNLCNTC